MVDDDTLREISVVMREAELRYMMKQRPPPDVSVTISTLAGATHRVHIEVVNTAHAPPPSLRGALNRHLLLLLATPACGVPVDAFEDALRDEAAAVLRARTDRTAALSLLADAVAPHLGASPLAAAVDVCTADPATARAPTDAAALALQMLAAGHELSEPFVQATLHGLAGRRVEALADLRLPVAPAAYLMGVPDPTNTLAPNHVYVHHGRGGDGNAAFGSSDGSRGRDVVVARFPLMRTDAIGVFRSVANDALARHFEGFAGGVVVFSTQPVPSSGSGGCHPVVALGGDYDGDLYLVCADRRIAAAVVDARARLWDDRPAQAPTWWAHELPVAVATPSGQTGGDGDDADHGYEDDDQWAAWGGDVDDDDDVDYGGGFDGDVPLVEAAVMPRSPPQPLPPPPAQPQPQLQLAMTFDFTALAPASPASSCDDVTRCVTRPPPAPTAPPTQLPRCFDPLPPHARALLAAAPRSLTPDDFQAALCWEFFDAALAAGGTANVGRLANAWLAVADRLGPDSPAAEALADAHDRALLARKHGGGGAPHIAPVTLDDVSYPHYMAANNARRPSARHGAGHSFFSTSAVGRLHDLAQHLLQDAPHPSLALPAPPPPPPPPPQGRARSLVGEMAAAGVRLDPDLRAAGATDYLELAQRIFDRLTADAAALVPAHGTRGPSSHAHRPHRAADGVAARACAADRVAALERHYRDVVCGDVVAELAVKLGHAQGAVTEALASALYEVAYLRAGERLAAAARFAAADDTRTGRAGSQFGDGLDRRRAAAMVVSAAAAMKVCWAVCGHVLNAMKRRQGRQAAQREKSDAVKHMQCDAPTAVTAGSLLVGLSEKRFKPAMSLSFRPPPTKVTTK